MLTVAVCNGGGCDIGPYRGAAVKKPRYRIPSSEFQKAPPGNIEISFPDVHIPGVTGIISERRSSSIVLSSWKVMFQERAPTGKLHSIIRNSDALERDCLR